MIHDESTPPTHEEIEKMAQEAHADAIKKLKAKESVTKRLRRAFQARIVEDDPLKFKRKAAIGFGNFRPVQREFGRTEFSNLKARVDPNRPGWAKKRDRRRGNR